MIPRTTSRRSARPWLVIALALTAGAPSATVAQQLGRQPLVHKLLAANERMEMTVNSSRILDLELRIPKAQVNNQDILELTALSPNQIQMFAKKPGVTQVNLWDESDQIHTIDVIVYGDAQELAMLLETEFPSCSLKVKPTANAVILSGYVDRPDVVRQIVEMASDYYPKVINNIQVGGVQQVLLQTRVMEVSRTRLRTLGVDWGEFNGNDFAVSSVSGLIGNYATNAGSITSTGGETFTFGIVTGANSFFGLLEALRENNMMKILAEPDIVAVSGRSASFNVGGEFPIIVPQSLGTVSIEYKKFGTQIDFVPIVLGNGRIRLEVRPRISEIDNTRSIVINNTVVPGLRVREVDTGVEMQAGQTFALAGLVQTRIEADSRGLPWLMDIPYVGTAFRRTRDESNEIELLILVTPQLVEPLDPHEVPEYGPGQLTCSPTDCELYFKGFLEVPCCGDGQNCGQCQKCRRHPRPNDPYAPTPRYGYGAGGMGLELGNAAGPAVEYVPANPVPRGTPTPSEGRPTGPVLDGPAPEAGHPMSRVHRPAPRPGHAVASDAGPRTAGYAAQPRRSTRGAQSPHVAQGPVGPALGYDVKK